MIAVSEPVDDELAELLGSVVSDGIIAPGYAPGTIAKLARKKRNRFHDHLPITLELLRWTDEPAPSDTPTVNALLGMITVRYTQSNTVILVRDGMTVGVGAGQQSRIDCTQLARHRRPLPTLNEDSPRRRQGGLNRPCIRRIRSHGDRRRVQPAG